MFFRGKGMKILIAMFIGEFIVCTLLGWFLHSYYVWKRWGQYFEN